METQNSATPAPAAQKSPASQLIPLSLIAESKTNPRKTYHPEAERELAESVRVHGILQPVVVRQILAKKEEPCFELVVGSRRLRAARAVGLTEVPAVIRALDDAQALEMQIIENLQREDVSPLEEGQGYRELLAGLAKSEPKRAPDGQGVRRQDLVIQIGKMVGKSPRYIYARMKLCELIPELQKDLAEGRIEASHADELVRLTAHDQKEIRDGGLYRAMEPEEKMEGPAAGEYVPAWQREMAERAISVRNLKTIIERDFQLTLDKAKFDPKSRELKPYPCTECPKNTAVNPLLPAAAKPTCTDKNCWREKMRQHVEAQARELGRKAPVKNLVQITLAHHSLDKSVKRRQDWKSAKPGECKNVQPAAEVEESGGVKHFTLAKTVCLNKQCKTHWAAPAGHGKVGSERSSGRAGAEKPLGLEELRALHKRRFEEHLGTCRGLALLRAALPGIEKLGEQELRALGGALANRWFGRGDIASLFNGEDDAEALVKKARPGELARLIFGLFFASEDLDRADDPAFLEYAKAKRIDRKKAESEFAASLPRCAICGCFEAHACVLGQGGRCSWSRDKRLAKVGRVCTNPVCLAEAGKRAGLNGMAPPKKAARAALKGPKASPAGKRGRQ